MLWVLTCICPLLAMYSVPRYGEWAGCGSGGTPGARAGPSVPPSSPPHTPPRTGAPSVPAVTRVAQLYSPHCHRWILISSEISVLSFVPLKARHILASGSLFAFGAGDCECEGIQKSPHTGETLLNLHLRWRPIFFCWIPWPNGVVCNLPHTTNCQYLRHSEGGWGEGLTS
jgi:hypothetical protein